MGNYVQQPIRKMQSKSDLIHLHSQLNNELEKFNLFINKYKELPITEAHHLEDERNAIMQSIQDINMRIQSKTTARKIWH